jgi:hypothetical protein
MSAAIWLAIYIVDRVVVLIRGRWQFSLQAMLRFTTVVCLILGVLAGIRLLVSHYVDFHRPSF